MAIIEAISSIIVGLRIPLSTLSGICFIFTSILLFSPHSFLMKIAISDSINNYKEIIGLIWLLSVSILVFYIICFIFDIISASVSKQHRIKLLNSLTDVQRQIVLEAYQNGGEIRLPLGSAHANLLQGAHILQAPSSSFATSADNFSIDYYLQPWVTEYLRKFTDF